MKNKRSIAVLFIALTFMVACDSEIDGKPAAVVAEAEATAEEESQLEEEEDTAVRQELEINTEESSIGWVGAKVTGDHVGGFEEWTGTAVTRNGDLEELRFTVDTTSIFSDNDNLTDHLMSDDFFDVEEYPKAKFESSRIAELEGEDSTHLVTGDFTIRGITQTVSFPASVEVHDDDVQASTEFTIDRFDFGIEYKGKPDDLIRDNVLLKIDLVTG